MIKFLCHCSHSFALPDDQAGLMIQCPKCGRLNDVPTLSDIANLEDGGIFKITEAAKSGNDLSRTARAFTRKHKDHGGAEIDMRHTVDEFLEIGADEIPLSLKDDELPGKPKYDPLTGELIEPVGIQKDVMPRAQDVPVAKRAISYAAGETAKQITTAGILLELFTPMSMFVMFIVLVAHLLAAFMMFPLSVITFFTGIPTALINPVIGLIIAHYASVIDEIGIEGCDELPRPLRNLSWSDDLMGPLWRFVLALFLCYFPALALRMSPNGATDIGELLTLGLSLCGGLLFPAVLLTTVTSGSALNLRPDRLFGVIVDCGSKYALAVITWIVISTITVWAAAGPGILPTEPLRAALRFSSKIPFFPVMLVGISIYGMHFFCWHLGLMYRAHHLHFPWILQRHIKRVRPDTMSQLEERRRQQERAKSLAARNRAEPPVQS